MKLQAFEYIVLSHPSKDEDKTCLITHQPSLVVAKDKETAKLIAARHLSKDVTNMDLVEIIVRPFV